MTDEVISKSESIEINLKGQSFRFSCSESEVDALEQASELIVERFNSLPAKGVKHLDRSLLIIALNLANDYLSTKQNALQNDQIIVSKIEKISKKIERMQNLISTFIK